MVNKEFDKLLVKIKELHDKKNDDYSDLKDPLSNLRECEKFGVPAWLGVLVRMSDKWSRIQQLAARKAKIKDETIVDTLMDLAVYSLLAIILYKENG